jgi:hypothetical protein
MTAVFRWGRVTLLAGLMVAQAAAADWVALFDGRSLTGWEPVGAGLWSITTEGHLLGIRDPRQPADPLPWFNSWKARLNRSWLGTSFHVAMNQAWLYTLRDFDEYDLELEYWLPARGNSGVSVRDQTRGRHTFGANADLRRTPSQVAYEIQLNMAYPDAYPSGSIYSLVKAREGSQKDGAWNRLSVEVRREGIRVRLNGDPVAEHPGVPGRPWTGPVGLQLHDENTVVLFRDIRIREIHEGSQSRAPAP